MTKRQACRSPKQLNKRTIALRGKGDGMPPLPVFKSTVKHAVSFLEKELFLKKKI